MNPGLVENITVSCRRSASIRRWRTSGYSGRGRSWRDRRMRAARVVANKGSPEPATPGSPMGQARGLKAHAA